MRLRKECEHGRWEAHRVGSWSNVPGLVPNEQSCPGGEFLPEGALDVLRLRAEWYRNGMHDIAQTAVQNEVPPLNATEIRERVAGFAVQFWRTLDALASQAGESE